MPIGCCSSVSTSSAATHPHGTEDGRPNGPSDEAVALLEDAGEQGLASSEYDATGIAHELVDLRSGATPASARELAVFDAKLTLALIRYTSHLAHGRIDPGSVYPDLEESARCAPRQGSRSSSCQRTG